MGHSPGSSRFCCRLFRGTLLSRQQDNLNQRNDDGDTHFTVYSSRILLSIETLHRSLTSLIITYLVIDDNKNLHYQQPSSCLHQAWALRSRSFEHPNEEFSHSITIPNVVYP
jgi:hypothetical protein